MTAYLTTYAMPYPPGITQDDLELSPKEQSLQDKIWDLVNSRLDSESNVRLGVVARELSDYGTFYNDQSTEFDLVLNFFANPDSYKQEYYNCLHEKYLSFMEEGETEDNVINEL